MTSEETLKLRQIRDGLDCLTPEDLCDPKNFDPDIGYTGYCRTCKAKVAIDALLAENPKE